MDLKTWLKSEGGRTVKLAEYLSSVVRTNFPPDAVTGKRPEIAYAQVSSWVADRDSKNWRPIPPRLARYIEEFTQKNSKAGEAPVMRWDCCPNDWQMLWWEMVQIPGHPIVPDYDQQTADA